VPGCGWNDLDDESNHQTLDGDYGPTIFEVRGRVAWLEKIAAGCPSLASLNLAFCNSVTDAGLEKIAAGCPSLASLSLSECFIVTDAGLEKIAAGWPRSTSPSATA
jgi:hypothetical protein